MKKIRILSLVMAMLMLVAVFAACNKNNGNDNNNQSNGEKTKVTLTVWGSQEDQAMLKEMCQAFAAANPDKEYKFLFGVQGEGDAADKVLNDVTSGPDVFSFASDQINKLIAGGALVETAATATVTTMMMIMMMNLASAYRGINNYTKAEYTLTNAIADGGDADLSAQLPTPAKSRSAYRKPP